MPARHKIGGFTQMMSPVIIEDAEGQMICHLLPVKIAARIRGLIGEHGRKGKVVAVSDLLAQPPLDTRQDAVNHTPLSGRDAAAAEALRATLTQPRPSDLWNCGNGHLAAAATLRLIEHARVSTPDAMEFIENMVREAGPNFARDFCQQQVPF